MTTVAIASDTVTAAIRRIVEGRDLDETEGFDVASVIMSGSAAPDRIAGLLVAMRMKGETVDETLGFVRAMRERVGSPAIADDSLVDTCGTGGDGKGTFNISTVSALVAAGAGCRVARHGNRSVSGLCGSSQLLEELGVPHDPGPEEAARCLDETGACFLFAPRYHQAARHAANCSASSPRTSPSRWPRCCAVWARRTAWSFTERTGSTRSRCPARRGSANCETVRFTPSIWTRIRSASPRDPWTRFGGATRQRTRASPGR